MGELDKATFIDFIKKICLLDTDKVIQRIVWEDCSEHIVTLLNNRYTFQAFWNYHNGNISKKAWKASFLKEREKALQAIKDQNVAELLLSIFSHLYTLRNQLIHGGATYNSKANRKQLNDACNILSNLIFIMIKVMIDNPESIDWGKPFYPYITSRK